MCNCIEILRALTQSECCTISLCHKNMLHATVEYMYTKIYAHADGHGTVYKVIYW